MELVVCDIVHDKKTKFWAKTIHFTKHTRMYPLVNIQKTMENHHFSWVNPLFLWSFLIANG